MKKSFRKIISASIVIAISSFSFNAYASDIDDSLSTNTSTSNLGLPEFVQYVIDDENMGEIDYCHLLLNTDGQITAYCLDFDSAYLIYDTNGEIIEYCENSESPLSGIEEDVYFAGPLSYFTKENDKAVDVLSNEIIEYSELVQMSDEFETLSESIEEETNGIMTTSSTSELTKVKNALSNKPRCFDYYTSGQCGRVAVTTQLFYYYDNIDSNILKSTYANSPKTLYDYLANYIPSNASYAQIKSGLDSAFSKISNSTKTINVVNRNDLSTSDMIYYTWGYYKYKVINQKIPAILLLQNHPSYKNHWVVTYGVIAYYDGSTLVKSKCTYVVNNGFGKNDVKINYQYADGFIYFS
ncbi:MAG: hypothetical protein LUI06_10500 [Ruminococcus sp.]|nr:hypothetical protein [Ruminococcus sp.]